MTLGTGSSQRLRWIIRRVIIILAVFGVAEVASFARWVEWHDWRLRVTIADGEGVMSVAPVQGESYWHVGGVRNDAWTAKLSERLIEHAIVPDFRQIARTTTIWLPFWIPTALLCAAIIWRGVTIHFDGCQSCGYDLTGNTTGVCPECGAAVAKAKA